MEWLFTLSATLILSMACTQAGGGVRPQGGMSNRSYENTRIATAKLNFPEGSLAQGSLNFEQMPNSTIVTYHLEGLQPKYNYQILLADEDLCLSPKAASPTALFQLRTTSTGSTENNFKTEEFRVSGDKGLLGRYVILAAAPPPQLRQNIFILGCGQVVPMTAEAAQ